VGTKPNIGLVTQWGNKGQGVVSRSIRSIFDERGYETSVLAINGKIAKTTGDWDQPGLSIGAEEKVFRSRSWRIGRAAGTSPSASSITIRVRSTWRPSAGCASAAG